MNQESIIGDGKEMETISVTLMTRLPLWAIVSQTHWTPLEDSIQHASELSYPKYIHQLPSGFG